LSIIERFRHWFEYEKEMHAKVVESLGTVPEERRGEADYQNAIDLLAHVAAARSLWLFRFGVTETGPDSAEELFPRDNALADVDAQLATMHARWSEYLQSLDDDAMTRVFEYRSVEGPRFKNRIEDLLAQLYGHSWYHRGQIATIVRRLGGTPAVTDYVFWSRESI
jgi:uncharacterized damage-inducible protein DinB